MGTNGVLNERRKTFKCLFPFDKICCCPAVISAHGLE